MDVVLGELAGYYRAERAYVLELNDEKRMLTERYAWNARGVSPHEDALAFTLDDVPVLTESLGTHKPVVLTEGLARAGLGDAAVEALEKAKIQSIFLMPLGREGKRVGFLGLDNPSDHLGNVSLLKSLANYACGPLERARGNGSAMASKERNR